MVNCTCFYSFLIKNRSFLYKKCAKMKEFGIPTFLHVFLKIAVFYPCFWTMFEHMCKFTYMLEIPIDP